jgi:DNA-directed RNA polymerase specialized sigma24 family protein
VTCLSWSAEAGSYPEILPGAIEESDLIQNVVVRLVYDDCAVMRAFFGSTERQWLAYLAVTTRSVVCDLLRRQGGPKRYGIVTAFARAWSDSQTSKRNQHLEAERNLLARELRTICERTIHRMGGEHADREILIFNLYFLDNLSIGQIAGCSGVNLSKAGVAKILCRLTGRVRKEIKQDLPRVIMSPPVE